MIIFDPVVLFFVLGAGAGLVKSDLKIPESFYNVLSIYLLLAIGIKGGIEIQKAGIDKILLPSLITIILGITITAIGFLVARKWFKMSFDDSIAMAAHYGSVSAVTFAVAISYLKNDGNSRNSCCNWIL